jgi:two-component system phosphate regulon sensor histidine kinase PhoR
LILRDIAREKRLAQLRADFISNVTHELKTPLTSIFMFTESLLLGRVKPAKAKNEYLSVILKESERLKRMISNILEFSKMEKGKPDYFFTETNLAALVNSALQEMDYWLDKENFEVKIQLDDSITMKVDPEKLKQAFVNLIGNAIKYSGRTKKLDIRLFCKTEEIVIEFTDHGIGIPEKQLSRIFEKFYRADPKEGVSGTGLGLTVVKETVAAHNGKIIVDSEVGKGSKFSIILYQKGAEV